MDAEEEQAEVRVNALCGMFDGPVIDMSNPGEPPGLLPRDDSCIGPYSAEDVRRAILKMLNYKSAP
eukprot:8901337-Pyramimonas_sp.AAC.1